MIAEETVNIHYWADRWTYQMKFAYKEDDLSKPAQISEDEDFTLYEWNEEDTFIKHTKAMIDESISNAERRNQVKIDGESTEETYDVFEGLFDLTIKA